MDFICDFKRNLKRFTAAFDRDETLKVKLICNPRHPSVPIAALMSGAMVSNDIVNRDVVAV